MAAAPAVIAGTTVAQTLLEGYGQAQQARSAAREADYRARMSDIAADTIASQTTAAVGQQERRSGVILGEQRAAIAQSGFGSSGTMLDIARQSGAEAKLDALTTRYEGATREASASQDAAMARWEADQQRKQAKFAIGSSLFMAPAKGYLGYSAAGGTFGAKGSGVMRYSAIPKATASAKEASSTLNPWWKF